MVDKNCCLVFVDPHPVGAAQTVPKLFEEGGGEGQK